MAFVLLEPPGFTDLPDNLLTPGAVASGFVFSALKDNASFGAVVPEIFYSVQANGSQVPLPISSVDGYQYQRNELVYVWEIENTVNPASGTPSQTHGLLWGEWYVEPNSGVVHCLEIYGTDDLTSWAQSNDGVLSVWTFGVRGRQLRQLAAPPTYTDLPASDFASDGAAASGNLTNLSHNAKRGSVQCEIIAVNPSNAPAWQPNTFYAAGSLVQPTGAQASGFWFVAANTGSSGPIEPTWPGVWHSAAPVSDGRIIWNVAGAGFYNGQQIPYPKSSVDGYQYTAADQVIPFLSFISTQSMPIQKQNGVVFTSGQRIDEISKSIVGVQPSNPVQGGKGGGPPGAPVTTQIQTVWNGTLQNWTPQIPAPAAPSLSQVAGGSLGATTYYVKITYTSPAGETTASAESSLAVAANNLLVVSSPAASGAATGYNVYVSTTSGAEQKQGLSPTLLGSSWTEFTTGLDPGAAPPISNTTGFVASAAEQLASPMLTPGSPTTGPGIVTTSVRYSNGSFADGTCMVWCLCFRAVSAMAAPGGAVFTDMATEAFTSGNPPRSDYMQDLNENTKFSILRPEFFFNANVTPGTAVPLPTSPVDGYAYARGELTYMWYFTYTGANAGNLRDFALWVDPITGIVNTRNDYLRSNNGTLATSIFGQGGQLTYYNMGGSGRGQQQINVIVVARRSHETELQSPVTVNPGGQLPSPPGPYNLIPNGNFALWSIPATSAVEFFGVADDWGVLQNAGNTAFFQFAGLGASKFAQAVSAQPSANSLSQRQRVTPPIPTNIASIGSMIIPVWPGGQYAYSFIAAARAQFSNDVISYGFYARIHLLAADSNGDPDTTTDTTFELLGPNLTVAPGLTPSNNPGGAVLVSPPNFTSFTFTFTIPFAGATFAQTSSGQSLLSQVMASNPQYVYVEFMLWDIVSSGTDHQRVVILDQVVLQDLTEGSTNLNQQGSLPTGGSDNAAFSYSSTTTSLSFWWTAFQLPQSNGTLLNVAANGSSGSPAVSFTGLSPSTTYYISARYNLATFSVELRLDATPLSVMLQTTWLNADGYIPVFLNWNLTTPASGGGGGGGSGGGSTCFTGATRVKTPWGFISFEQLPRCFVVENERGRFMADHIVHDEAEVDILPIGDGGGVTPDHALRWTDGKYEPAGSIFAGVKTVKHRGKLHNLKVRSTNPDDGHYIVEGGYVAHNPKYK